MEMFIFFISLKQYKKNSPVQKICVPENLESGGYLRSVFIQLPDSVKKSAYITQKPSQTGCYKASD